MLIDRNPHRTVAALGPRVLFTQARVSVSLARCEQGKAGEATVVIDRL